MKVRKKRKEAEREGEASSVTVSQRVLPAPSPLEGAFLGQEDLPLLTQLEKRERDRERGQGEREAAEGIWHLSFLQLDRLRDAQRFVYSPLER